MLRQLIAGLILICSAPVSHAEEPKIDPKDAGRDLRNVFLTTTPEKFGVQPSNDYPRVCAIAMDWPIDEHFATVVSVCDGSASVYTTGTFGIIGGIGHETVRTAAKKLVKEADRYYDDSTPTQDFSYPSRGHVRFYLLTFGGVRVIETDLAAVTKRRGKYSTLFDLAQDVIGQLWIVIDEHEN
jgi:hypothetical protein